MFSTTNRYAARIVAPNKDRIVMSAHSRYERRELLKMAVAASLVLIGMIVGGWHVLGGL